MRAVVVHNTESVLGAIGPLNSWKAIRSWFDSLVALQTERADKNAAAANPTT